MVKAFLKLEEGKQVEESIIEYYKTTSFRLKPLPDPEHRSTHKVRLATLDIDGELYEFTELEYIVLPGMLRVMCHP